jgi:hypothetical protein
MVSEFVVGVVVFSLFFKIKSTVGSWIIAHPRQIHPVSVITAGVVIEK